MKIAIVGATGFVGRALAARLTEQHDVIAVVRRARVRVPASLARVRCMLAELTSPESLARAFDGADVVVYLVHSMAHQDPWTTARFEDLDLLFADNVARAAAKARVPRIVYLGGIIADGALLSRHLESRLEVESALEGHGATVTTLRAGLVVGPGGSSFRIMERLARRLPLMICPRWTDTPSQPIALDDAVDALRCAIEHAPSDSRSIDIGGPDVLTYREMLEHTRRLLGRSTRAITVPILSPGLSRLWVQLVTGADRPLVFPLIESLKTPMVARNAAGDPSWARGKVGFDAAVRDALRSRDESPMIELTAEGPREAKSRHSDRRALSVQRLPLSTRAEPATSTNAALARDYLAWVERVSRSGIRVRRIGPTTVELELATSGIALLRLDHASEDGALRVTGGVLADPSQPETSALRFHALPKLGYALAEVRDYRPRLPWALYRTTQSALHERVMHAYGRHLADAGRRAFEIGQTR